MKKILSVTAAVLELALIIGTWVVHYFSNKKMGMMRYVVFKNTRWSQNYPLETLRLLTVAVIAVLTVSVLVLFWKRVCQAGARGKVTAVETAVLSAVYIGFNLFCSVQSIRSFYFISGMLALACILQLIRTGIAANTK